MEFLPDLLTFENGTKVENTEDWRKRRLEILDILQKYEYGYTPEKQGETVGKVLECSNRQNVGHWTYEKLQITFPTEKGDFSFPAHYFRPFEQKKVTTFVMLNFRPDKFDMYCPVEEIIDNGFAVAIIHFNDITNDNGDFTDKLAGMFSRRNDKTDWGKIGMWAFAASRLTDYLLTREEVGKIGVIGHSRLGKTALWCGAQDERFDFAISNDSGCSGAAYERIKHEGAETIEIITKVFPYWFCENYFQFAGNPDARPFDQHYLLSLLAPRMVLVGSASQDDWADQYSEQLSCMGASPAWKLYGKAGYVGKETPAEVYEHFDEGDIHYHLRHGAHFFSRNDWNYYMNYLKEKLK